MSRTAIDIDKAWQPTLYRASICLDSELVLVIERLEEQLDREKHLDTNTNRTAVAPAIATRILELREEAKAAEVEFVFKSIGRGLYTDLIRKHQPTDEQQQDAAEIGQRLGWNPDTFPPALMALAAVEPTGTDESWWARKYDEWGIGQITRIWNTCLAAQGGVVEVPKATAASELMSGSEPSSN